MTKPVGWLWSNTSSPATTSTTLGLPWLLSCLLCCHSWPGNSSFKGCRRGLPAPAFHLRPPQCDWFANQRISCCANLITCCMTSGQTSCLLTLVPHHVHQSVYSVVSVWLCAPGRDPCIVVVQHKYMNHHSTDNHDELLQIGIFQNAFTRTSVICTCTVK